jgi:hypothetical protein
MTGFQQGVRSSAPPPAQLREHGGAENPVCHVMRLKMHVVYHTTERLRHSGRTVAAEGVGMRVGAETLSRHASLDAPCRCGVNPICRHSFVT